jgi:tyrosine-protein phosphatase SIW14
VHCTHGQDRTGLVVGLYRTIHDGWTKTDAYREMLQLGFHPELRGLREFWEDFVAPPLWDH